MNNNKKCEGNNQWSGSNECVTNKANRNKKDATNNEWTSTLKMFLIVVKYIMIKNSKKYLD
ncbi:hypothetical protein [Romboutsia hominis]|uniref:hypothetical protein n=1 Tax=Romboutsia hominis TaxID=1507512 RepID=UPI001F05B076|nr:hypothetical protein [Romboutsia hominis]MCH1969049.1 hypothetical protein [Romboutsia hominis]